MKLKTLAQRAFWMKPVYDAAEKKAGDHSTISKITYYGALPMILGTVLQMPGWIVTGSQERAIDTTVREECVDERELTRNLMTNVGQDLAEAVVTGYVPLIGIAAVTYNDRRNQTCRQVAEIPVTVEHKESVNGVEVKPHLDVLKCRFYGDYGANLPLEAELKVRTGPFTEDAVPILEGMCTEAYENFLEGYNGRE